MGKSELRAALQREITQRTEALWRETEAQVEARRRQVARELAERDSEEQTRLDARCLALRTAILRKAGNQAATLKLGAEAVLAERLIKLAGAQLAGLYAGKRQDYYCALFKELPAASWQTARVHPEDVALAGQLQPEVDVVACPELDGGMIVESDQGRVRIDNSLRQRLHRGWPELLPGLLAELRDLVENHATSESDSSK